MTNMGWDRNSLGDLNKIGKEKGKTRLILYIILVIFLCLIVGSLFMGDN